MAIHNPNQTQTQTQDQTQGQSMKQETRKKSITGSLRPRTINIGRRNSDARVETLRVRLNEALEASGLSDDVKVIPLRTELRMKSLAVVVSSKDENDETNIITIPMFVQTVNDDTTGFTQPKTLADGTQIDVPIYPIDTANKVAQQRVTGTIRKLIPGGDVYRTVFPMIVTLDADLQSDDVIGGLLFNALDRINHEIDPEHAAIEYLAELRNKRINLRTEFNPRPLVNIDSRPVRADIAVNAVARPKGHIDFERQIHQIDESVVRVDGYIDLMEVAGLSPQREMLKAQNPYFHQFASGVHFRPIVNITNIQPGSDSGNYFEAYLLGLANISTLGDNMAAVLGRYYRPRQVADGGVNTRNLGAIGLSIPDIFPPNEDGTLPSGILDTSAREWATNEAFLHTLINDNLNLNPVYALHLEDGSELSYLYRDFVNLSANTAGNDSDAVRARRSEARANIVSALDRLTGNRFSDIFDASQPIVNDSGYTLLNGYITTPGGEREDIRKYQDLLAIMNLHGEHNPNVVADFLDALYNTSKDQDLRLERIRNILNVTFNHQVTYTGKTRVVYLTSEFINALRTAISGSDIELSLDWVPQEHGDERVRSYAGINQLGVVNSVYVQPMANTHGGVSQGFYPTQARW